jgi:DNA-binding MarR family transcriptional regulator
MVALDECLIRLMSQVKNAHYCYLDQALRELDLYPGQEPVLLALAEKEGMTQVQLAQRMGCEPQTINKTLRRMQEAGLVERRNDPEDGRLTRVFLTEHGRSLVPAVQEIVDRGEERLNAGLTREEQELVHRLLHQMVDNFENGPSDLIMR